MFSQTRQVTLGATGICPKLMASFKMWMGCVVPYVFTQAL
jgi:hypothetical protein